MEREKIVAAPAAVVDDSGELVPVVPAAEKYAAYRQKLSSLTLVTRDHFENLARAFRDGLAEVDTTVAAANAAKAAEKAAAKKAGERADDPVAYSSSDYSDSD
jgi:hypothetical protein